MNILLNQMYEAFVGESSRVIRLIDEFETYGDKNTIQKNSFVDSQRVKILRAAEELNEFGMKIDWIGAFYGRREVVTAVSTILVPWFEAHIALCFTV